MAKTKPNRKQDQQAPAAEQAPAAADQTAYAVERARAEASGNAPARTGRPNVSDEARIVVPVDNPKKPGSMAHGRLADLLERYGGQTVAVGDALRETAYTRADLNWDLRRGTVVLADDQG